MFTSSVNGEQDRGQRRAGVEAEPAEPEDPRAEHREWQGVWRHRRFGPTPPPAEHQHHRERGDARVDVHDRAAREVERAASCEPTGRREHPVRDRRVHEHHPQAEEPDPRAEPHPVGDRPVMSAGVITTNIIWYTM